MTPLDHRDRSNRAYPYTELNSCFGDSSDSLNSLNSLKVSLNLERTPLMRCYVTPAHLQDEQMNGDHMYSLFFFILL